MANLIIKKLSKMPIGTHVELTYSEGDSNRKVSGILTDSDFSESVEITSYSGEQITLDFSLILGVVETRTLKNVLAEAPIGTSVRYSYGDEEYREPRLTGTVVENDNEDNIEIELSSGKRMILNYDLIRSFLPTAPVEKNTSEKKTREEKSYHLPQPPKAKDEGIQKPENFLNVSDMAMKECFEAIPYEERKKLASVYDSFKYGIKVSDHSKMATAANQARQILFREDDQGFVWSAAAVRFCGYLLRRVNIYDPEVFLIGECFKEAAYACWHEKAYIQAGTYAILALLDGDPENIQDMVNILASSVVKAEDISALRIFKERMPAGQGAYLHAVIDEAFSAKGIKLTSQQDTEAALNMLAPIYPNKDMEEELKAWLPEEQAKAPAADSKAAEPPAAPVSPVEPKRMYGTISRLNWAEHTGIIDGDDKNSYTFHYQDIADTSLSGVLQGCLRSDLDGKTYIVKFYAEGTAAREIRLDNTLVDRAKTISLDTSRSDRFEAAFALCKVALGTSDIRRALGELVRLSIAIFTSKQQTDYLKEALSLYEKNITYYPNNAFRVMNVAQAYAYLKKYPQMLEHAEKAMEVPGLAVKQKIGLASQYLTMLKEYYEVSGDKALLEKMLEKTAALKADYAADFESDAQVRELYNAHLLHHRIFAECGLDRLDEAEADYANMPEASAMKYSLGEVMSKLRARLAPKGEEIEDAAEQAESDEAEEEEDSLPDDGYDDFSGDDNMDIDEEIVPYTDHDGWDALGLTKKAVIDYALSITGPDRTPSILAYLRAGAALNKEIEPVYHAVALATNDPMESPDYSITALVTSLADSDTDYPRLNDCCMAAAFLRTSFLSGRGYDYSAQGLRSSIAVNRQISALDDVYDTLELFRRESGSAIDIYADYRNQGVLELKRDLNTTVRHAEDLYTQFVVSPARESAKFARFLETRKIVFAKDGYLATMLHYIVTQNQDALESEKEGFVAAYLNGEAQFSAKHIDKSAIDKIIMDCWDIAGKNLRLKRVSTTLQGDRRNNLRSNISEVLNTICQWYALTQQSLGITWRTEQGEAAYRRLRPQLVDQLNRLSGDCLSESESSSDPQLKTGLFLLAATAQELSARLDGSWKFEQERYMYVDFLRSSWVMLNEDFLPELSSTFCVLPNFNILSRIRRHVEGPKLSFQEQIDRIYGTEKTLNNYGTADRIVEYLEAMDQSGSVIVPENADCFLSHTEMQIDMRFRGFRETYALAMNYGQIIKSDTFCYTLEDTIRYWYAFCRESKNYGFFTSILMQAEEQIHASAQQYELQLNEQLDALIASNQQYFDEHHDFADAIRAQIFNQNFTVAEDWMARIRIGDFSLDIQQPEAIGYLEQFWNNYVDTYSRVADASRALGALLGHRETRNKDSKRGQQLIDSWLSNGNPSHSMRIQQLLNLLGWQNILVSPYHFPAETRGEFYEVRKESSAVGLTTPLHPIAAFGSELEKKPMYVACLYGIYDCDRLYEKMRTLDVIDGSKVILLDYALGQADRRALARKLKKRENGLKNVNIVIDRVLIAYLADNYNENLINRILMATAMPFSYCQPYVVESVHTMPPEIFIGRKDELMKIERADGVNLIYGGRQLGKSALFKKALADVDGHHGQRAVLIDIKELDCAAAAKKLSTKLIDLGITPDAEITEDWDVLCRNIEQHIRNGEEEITYFLLMLDEADAFINDCANCGYRPLAALKDVQQSLPGRFKYVLAGLHNIVKFNRQVALGNNSVITHMASLKITPFHTPEAEELLTNPLSYLGFSLPSKVTVSQILATCNYFPGLIQLYAQKLIESIRAADYAGYDIKRTPPYVVSDEHLRRVMADKEFIDQIHEKFEITLTLDQDQGSCYYPLALVIGWMYSAAPSKNGYTAKDVLFHAKDLSIHPLADMDEEKINALLLELQDLNILRSVSNDSYLLASKNFRDLLGTDEEIFEKLMKVGGGV